MNTHSFRDPSIALAVPVSIPYRRDSDDTIMSLIGRTLREIFERSGLKKHEVDGLAVSSFTLEPDTAASIAVEFEWPLSWLEQVPFGGASGVIALRRAASAVRSGDAEVVVCLAADAMNTSSFVDLASNFARISNESVYPYGAAGTNAVFALMTRHYMERFGATREDFGRLCVDQRHNANHYPGSLFRERKLTLEEYLRARPIVEPLHLYDCVMPCTGAEAFLVMSEQRARSLNLECATLRSSAEAYNAFHEDPLQIRGGWAKFRDELYDCAGMSPEEIDIVQPYDDYPVIVFQQLEDLGFCRKGEASAFIRDNRLTFDTEGLVCNSNGGQLSAGQAGAAGGFLGLVEAVRQLTDSPLPNRVRDAKAALVSGYGMAVYDRCVCTNAAILTRRVVA